MLPIRIGKKIQNPDKKLGKGTILQSCMYLPKSHNVDTKGPWYGVSYETGEYRWYISADMEKMLEEWGVKY